MRNEGELLVALRELVEKLSSSGQENKLRDFYVARKPVVAEVGEFSMTRQEFKDECDINVLMSRYEKAGVWPNVTERVPQYLDVSDVPDLRTAMEYIERAQEAFMTLPATVRREFDNDAVQFVEFASDPANIGRMREWGLAPSPPVPPAAPAPSVPSPAPASSGSTHGST